MATTICLKTIFKHLKFFSHEKSIRCIRTDVEFLNRITRTETTKEKKEKAKTELKAHECTDACHAAGKCVMAHDEKGHVCTDDCKAMKADTKKAELKDHVCTDACKTAGKCVMAHGEKGHECTDACKKKM